MIDTMQILKLMYAYTIPRVPMLAIILPLDVFISVFTAVQQSLKQKVVIDMNFGEWGSIASVAKEMLDILKDPTPEQRAEFVYVLLGFLTDIESKMDMPTFVGLVMEKLQPNDRVAA